MNKESITKAIQDNYAVNCQGDWVYTKDNDGQKELWRGGEGRGCYRLTEDDYRDCQIRDNIRTNYLTVVWSHLSAKHVDTAYFLQDSQRIVDYARVAMKETLTLKEADLISSALRLWLDVGDVPGNLYTIETQLNLWSNKEYRYGELSQ